MIGSNSTTGYLLELTHKDGTRYSEIYASRQEAESAGKEYEADKQLDVVYYVISKTQYFQYGQDQF